MELREYRMPSSADCHCAAALDDHGPLPVPAGLEDRYQAAKARLLAAQQEKLEAAVEFLAARAAVHRRLETVWPDQDEWPHWELAAGV